MARRVLILMLFIVRIARLNRLRWLKVPSTRLKNGMLAETLYMLDLLKLSPMITLALFAPWAILVQWLTHTLLPISAVNVVSILLPLRGAFMATCR